MFECRGSLLCAFVIALLVSTAIAAPSPKLHTARRVARNIKWQYQLSDEGVIKKLPGVQLYDIDMDTAGDGQLAELKKQIPGAKVICYISVGSWESYRAQLDKTRRGILPTDWTSILGKTYSPPWTDERWLDLRSNKTREIMAKRFDYAKKIGCDGVDPDNTGAHEEPTGFPLTKADAIAYSKWVAKAVHDRGMLVGLKNTLSLLPDLHQDNDFFVNEQCGAFNECSLYTVVGSEKPVFGAEYCDATAAGNGVTQDPGCYCPEAISSGRNVLIKTTDLNDKGISCADYCAVNACPGRANRKNCKAGKASVCKAAFARRPAAASTTATTRVSVMG